MSGIYSTLYDKGNSDKNVCVRVELVPDGLYVYPVGYGDSASPDGHGSPVMLELYDGELRAVIWSDINEGDPTHIISLEKALESNREVSDDMLPNFCHNCGLDLLTANFEDVPKGICPNCCEKIMPVNYKEF